MTGNIRNENHILFASAQALQQINQWKPSLLAEDFLDWQYIFSEAIQHRTVPLLQYFLKQHPQFIVPENIRSAIDQYVHRQALANIFQANELLRVVTRFEEENIDAIPFKGPSLGILLYNQLTFRAFGDLDILIKRKDFFKVKEILMDMGYTPYRKLSKQKELDFLATQMGYEFVRQDNRCVIEIHWSLISRVHSFEIPDDELWNNKKAIKIESKLVPRLDDEHLFIYLCAHGTKSFWARLRWISDIAELISINSNKPDTNSWWTSLLNQASLFESLRMVHLGIYLAHKLLNAPVPEFIITEASKDRNVILLYNRVVQALFEPPDQKKGVLKPISFHLHMRERIRDKLPYISHVIKLWSQPSKKDEDFLNLPSHLNFLYILVKPFRIVSQFLSRKTN